MKDRNKLLKKICELKRELNIDLHWERLLSEDNLSILLKALQDKKKGKKINLTEIHWA